MLSKDNLIIRDARIEDIQALALLMNDLGYPTNTGEMETRFNKINSHPDYKTIVAELNNEVVGMAGLCKGIYYEMDGLYMRILAFVVKESCRKMGIGKKLILAAENWAVEQGLKTILINSGNRVERQASHLFYEQMGYEVKSSGFVKKL
jgi:N-acetylglutamate synthase-like GNAT family acetyltransferase